MHRHRIWVVSVVSATLLAGCSTGYVSDENTSRLDRDPRTSVNDGPTQQQVARRAAKRRAARKAACRSQSPVDDESIFRDSILNPPTDKSDYSESAFDKFLCGKPGAQEPIDWDPEIPELNIPQIGATRCVDVTSIDYNWYNDMRCTRPDGSVFYTDYRGAAQFR